MEKKQLNKRHQETIDLLLKEGLITQDMLSKAREEVKRTGFSLENALEKLGYITEEDIVKAQANALGIPYVDLTDYVVDAELVKLIPENMARKHKAVPLFKIGNNMTVGMVDPQDIVAIDQLRRLSQMEMIEPVLVSEKGLHRILDSYHQTSGSIDEIVKSIDSQKISEAERKGLHEAAEEAPIIKLVNSLIFQAVKERASDIHVEPSEEHVRIRFRIDGLLNEMHLLPKKLQNAVISRIKVLSKMDIAENRKPQDGRIQQKIETRDLDIRVSTFPTIHGENVVMRLLDKSAVLLGLKRIGLQDNDFQDFEKLIKRPHGIILVTGPTGSGKTSSLYAALTHINSTQKNIITIEDPVEYELPLVRQTQVNPKAGITFANGLRSILRQDPDIIMVGEIRDKETADVAIQAAMTGHLVFSTLHTNDAPSSLARLIDMGVEPFLISSSVVGIAAQRLVRLICEKCKEKHTPQADVLKLLGFQEKMEFYQGKGCNYCKGSGFVGRTGIFELLVVNDDLRKLVDAKASADTIRKKARELGMRTLREDGIIKAKQGQTTLEEVLRVTEVDT